ncbi:kinase-like protein [Thelephora ganbajun]|uniref:Kinase-like protein n=1 Tax=Thelephora ganbajun TaxID=370292 RepID=A0ACB6Z521_THEGA|nr:kinase-like protein [Thelephora ganbajun]
MRCPEEVLATEACIQANPHTNPLAGSLYRFCCAMARTVTRAQGHPVLKLAACPPPSWSPLSEIRNPSSLDDDPLRQYHSDLAQKLRSSLPPTCNWLEEEDVRIVGGRPISSGGFADLWRGSFDNRQVAIKSYRRYLYFDLSHIFLRFSQEALVCGRLSHRNIVSFVRIYSTTKHPFSLVFNFVGHLDLREYLKTHPTARRLELLAGIARGLDHMHDLDIIHGSLKAGNVLVDLDGTARIAGLGSTLTLGHPTVWSEMSVGRSFRGSAPELIYPEEFGLSYPQNSKASDIHAFGVLAWEVFTGRAVFSNSLDVVAAHAMWKGARPPRPDHPEVSDRVWEMIKQCWERVPSKRTTIREVVCTLEAERKA